MFKANVGTSIRKSAKAAGTEAAGQAAQGLSGIKFAFVYSSCDYATHNLPPSGYTLTSLPEGGTIRMVGSCCTTMWAS